MGFHRDAMKALYYGSCTVKDVRVISLNLYLNPSVPEEFVSTDDDLEQWRLLVKDSSTGEMVAQVKQGDNVVVVQPEACKKASRTLQKVATHPFGGLS